MGLGSCCCSRNKGCPTQKNPELWFLGATWTQRAKEKEPFPPRMAQDLCLLAVSSSGEGCFVCFKPEAELCRWSELRCSLDSRGSAGLQESSCTGQCLVWVSLWESGLWSSLGEDSWLVFPEEQLWVCCSVRAEQWQLSLWLDNCCSSALFSFVAVIPLFPPRGSVTALLSSSPSVWEPVPVRAVGGMCSGLPQQGLLFELPRKHHLKCAKRL